MLLKDKIVQMNTGFKVPKLVLLKERLGTQVFLLLNEINLVRMSPSTILKINFQINFSWLPTKWRSTIYGTNSKNFTIICVNLQVSASYMDPYTSLIMEVFKGEKKSNENYNY